MARISTYEKIDGDNISRNDLIVGSQELGIDINGPIYETKSYRIGDLADFFGINVDAITTQLGSYTDGVWGYSSALATQTLSVVTTAGFASASYITNLEAQVGTFNADGSLTLTEAFANQVLNVTTTTEYASTSFATNLASSLGTYNPDGSIASLSSSFADSVLSTMNTSSLASASSVTQLTATLTNDYRTTTATNTQINESVATETSARASAVTTLNTSINIKPNIIRATSAPSIIDQVTDGAGQSGNITTTQDPAMGSLWIDISTTTVTAADGSTSQEPKNEIYVLQGSAGSASWLKTQDASLLNVITSAATATSSLSTLTTADIAKAEQLTELEAQFTVESDGTISGVDPSKTIAAATNTARNTAIATANKASATRENNLTANVQKVFNQNSAPSVTLATQITASVNSAITDSVDLVIDGQSSGTIVEGMVITGSGISGDVVVITVTNQNTLVLSSPQTLANNAVLTFNKAQSPPVNSLWYDTTDVSRVVKNAETGVDTTTSVPGNILHVLTTIASSPYYSWVENPDALLATQASVNTTASATADINGKLSSRYGVKVTAGGVFAGMELIARSDNLDPTGAGSVSDIIFTSTNFKIKTLDSNGDVSPVAPFAVSGTTVTMQNVVITGSLLSGQIQSSNFNYSSGNFSTAGTQFDLTNGVIISKNFSIDTSGNAYFNGNITSTSGNIGGWTLGTSQLYSSTKSTLASTVAGVYLGTDGIALANTFKVTSAGVVNATSGTIGGWTLSGAGLYNGRNSMTSTTAGVFIGQTGIALGSAAAPAFKVTSAGVLNATGATISGSITVTNTGDFAPTDAQANDSNQNNPSSYDFGPDATFDLASVGTPTNNGLYIGSDKFGFYNSSWKTYMDSSGNFYLNGTNGSLAWDSTANTLAITGAINATSGSFTGNITSDSGNIGGWVIDGGQFSSPQVSSVSRIKISPTGGISVNDTSGNPKCVITTGDLTDLTAGNPSLPDFNAFNLPGNDLTSVDDYSYGGTHTFSVANTGTYSGTIAYTQARNAYITPAGFSGYMSVSLGYQIATDSSFNNVISSSVITSVSSSTNASAFTGTLPARTVGIQATFSAASNHYARYYYRRVGGGNKVTNFLASNIPSVTNTSLAMAADATELTDRGFQVVSDSNTYFRIKRASGYYNTALPYVQIGGALSTTGNITAYYSDGRLKEVEGKIENALDKIDKINGIYYKENELARGFGFKNEKRQVGLIAQEVNEILPEVIDLAPFDMDVDDGTSKSGKNYMTLSYSKLVPLLVECIKELKKEVEDLKKNN